MRPTLVVVYRVGAIDGVMSDMFFGGLHTLGIGGMTSRVFSEPPT